MWFCCRLIALIFLSLSALASELSVKVVDPQSAAVSEAQVELYTEESTRPVAIQTTSAQGIAHFGEIPSGGIRVRVLAPGFAKQWQSVAQENAEQVTVVLQVAVATETVVVTATRTPVPSDAAGASISTLSGAELDTMRPVAANDALRFLSGAIVSTSGQRGGLASLFVRGGDSRYNRVIVDGVPVNDPGGIFDFGTIPFFGEDRVEFLRGAQSTLYGSDAMTSVVQTWSSTGSTAIPELRFGADAGNYGSENGYASLAGAYGRFDYNVFGNQFNTSGSGPNADYSNSLEGANLGSKLNDWAALRLRGRHDHSVAGVQNEWNFNGNPLLSPDMDQRARQNNFLGSVDLAIHGPSRWQHRLTAFEYSLRRRNVDSIMEPGRYDPAFFFNVDSPFDAITNANRSGFDYQGDYAERSWALTTVGYGFEDEHGTVGDRLSNSLSDGLRRNHAIYGQQVFTFSRGSLIAGGRFVHNESFGNKFVPRGTLTLLVLRGGQLYSGTRLRFGYATGIKEPTLSESFGSGGGFVVLKNPFLRPEETRSLEGGFEQRFGQNYSFSATYFNNLFRNKVDFNFLGCDPVTFICKGQYVNVNEAIAHGAEAEFQGRISSRLRFNASYTYTSTQILKEPFAFDPILSAGQPLIRRPKHSATTLFTYLGSRWGADLAGSFVGRRADSDFFGFNVDHAPGYILVNTGGWFAINRRMTAYVNVENLLNRFYEEVTGYPALGINFRAGMRFRVGGD